MRLLRTTRTRPRDRTSVHVVYVEPVGPAGGMGSYNVELIEALESIGSTVTLVGPKHPLQTKTVVRFTAMMDRGRSTLARMGSYAVGVATALLRGARADVVVWHFPHVAPLDCAAVWLLRSLGVRAIVVAHDPKAMAARSSRRWDSAFFRSATAVVVHGPVARSDLMAMGIPEERILVGHLPDYRPQHPMSKAQALEILGLERADDRRWVVVVGNLKPEKGVAELLPVWESLAEVDDSFRLLIAGSPQNNDVVTSAIAVAKRVTGIIRRLTTEEEAAAYQVADVVLTPYLRAYSSAVIATAHGYGKPIVSSPVGDLPQQLGGADQHIALPWSPDELLSTLRDAAERRTEGRYTDRDPREEWRRNASLILGSQYGRRPSKPASQERTR